MTAHTSISMLLTSRNRLLLYLSSLLALFFSENYCINVCPFIDGLSESELIINLFIVFILHLIFREILYRVFPYPRNHISLPRHAYYLSIFSWIFAGVAAFILHGFKYPDFPIGSHLKLLSSYWILGGGIFAQLEYILFERTYKKLTLHIKTVSYNERISRRIVETYLILTVAPAITIFLILFRYLKQGTYDVQMILEIAYVLILFVGVGVICSIYFGKMLKEDAKEILNVIDSIKKGNYDISIPIKRADELGEISHAIESMAHDIDQLNEERHRKNAEILQMQQQMLQQSRNAAMGEMISMIAHQWRQPLSVIKMYADNISMRMTYNKMEPGFIESTLTHINEQILYMSKTIDDFRDFFKPDKEKTHINVNVSCHNALKLVSKNLENRNIQIITELHSVTQIRTFERELTQVVLNLINNARDALLESNPDKPFIKITSEDHAEAVTLAIQDNGGGIPENIIEKIFDPYFTTKGKTTGTGIGLHMAKTIIEKHFQGSLEVKNHEYGACFTITLPIQSSSAQGLKMQSMF